MNSWRPYPLVRIVLPFLAGIVFELAGINWQTATVSTKPAVGIPGGHTSITLLLLSLFLVQLAWLRVRRYGLRWVPGLLANIFMVMAGYSLARSERPTAGPDSPEGERRLTVMACVSEPPALTRDGCRTILDLYWMKDQNVWQPVGISVIAYVKVPAGRKMPQYGDHLLLCGSFGRITDNANPHVFNYPRYLMKKGITHRVYLESREWKRLSVEPSNPVRRFSFMVRNRLLDILRENRLEGEEFAVAAALLLGYTDEIDSELRREYASTGAMHILSVSGMHVGIIYLFLDFMLKFMDRKRAWKLVKFCLVLALVWFYALITGLSPSVLRSAAMISLPILGKFLDRSADMFNVIAASLLLILVADPLLLTDTGFQLSYLAVVGIILLYKPIYDLYITSRWLADKLWALVAVSLAAQLATLPLTLFIFHQFPNYFLLTNLAVVPLSSVVIYTGILALAFSQAGMIGPLIVKLLSFLVWLLNTVIRFIDSLPGSVTQGIYLTDIAMLTLYGVLLFALLFLIRRRTSYLMMALAGAIFLVSGLLYSRYQRMTTSEMVIFNCRKEPLYLFRFQDRAIVLYERESNREYGLSTRQQELVTAMQQACRIRHTRVHRLSEGHLLGNIVHQPFPLEGYTRHIQVKGCHLLILDRKIPRGFRWASPVGLLVVTGNPVISMAEIQRLFRPGVVVVDATNSRRKTRQWLNEAAALGLRCHVLERDGAYQKDF